LTSSLFRAEVLRRRGESAIGETIDIVPMSQVAFAGFLAAVIAVAVVYATFAGYSRKSTAQGIVTPSRGVVRVMAPRPGTIVELYVHEGDSVVAGQQLFTVVAEESGASGTGSDTAILEALAQQKLVLQTQIANERSRNDAEEVRLQAQLRDLTSEIDQLVNQRGIQARRAQEARSFYERIAPYRDKGIVTAFEFQNRLQTALTEEQSLASVEERLSAKRGDLEQARLHLKNLSIEEVDRLSTLQRNLSDNEQRAAEIEGRRRYSVRASIAGQVTSLQARLGGLVDPHILQLSIVPDETHFLVELFVPAAAIGFVRPGQHVRLLYDAFPFQRFGTYGGTVESVAATMLAPKDVPEPVSLKDPAYRVKVTLDRQSIDAFGRQVPLQPDMTLRADIILEKRTLLEWLLEPLLSARGRMS